MPIYEFQCQQCDEQTELLLRGSETPACPSCGSQHLTKLLSVVATPAREGSGSELPQMPPGPCGSACGCFPQG